MVRIEVSGRGRGIIIRIKVSGRGRVIIRVGVTPSTVSSRGAG